MIHEMIDGIIEREGGYVDHSADRGGATNMGVTQSTLAAYRGHPVSKDDVKNLTKQEVRQIYYDKYWVKSGFGQLNLATLVEELLLDSAVHHGVAGATKLLQKAVAVKADGVIGPVTRTVVNSMAPDKLAAALCAERVAKFGRIITNDHSQAVFAAGWMNRMRHFITSIPSL
jgi:lysozyme family protein